MWDDRANVILRYAEHLDRESGLLLSSQVTSIFLLAYRTCFAQESLGLCAGLRGGHGRRQAGRTIPDGAGWLVSALVP